MPTFRAHFLFSVAAVLMLAGCSQSSERFAEGPSSENPSDSDPVYTASVPKHKRYASAGDDDTITSRPLGGTKNYRNSNGYTYNNSTYKTPAYKPRVPQVAQDDEPEAHGSGGRVTVGHGMTLYSIARANNVTVAELAAANRLRAPYAVHAGQVLRIPGSADAVAPVPRIASSKRASGGTHKVASGETLFALGRKYGVSPYAIADLNGLPHDHALQLGQRVKIPSNGKIAAVSKTQTRVEPEAVEEEPVVDEAPEEVASTVSEPAEEAADEKTVAQIPAEEPSIGMRWPVRGKIISSYGSKPNGLKNEGINIAVPEGASVRAAESGVVAYAGNELKGYGNLVLIRHDGGYVTAYAHAKELFVKRGDTVKRGDVIAKAGQTGSVSSPQLHFEVRKGATAMDPMRFLSSSTASN